ncbi:hypothetical protein ACFL6S_18480 [Candidatus Poribacteria bacterium]
MKLKGSKGLKKNLSYISITVLIVAMLFFSGPASAVTVGISHISDTTPTVGELVSFRGYVDIDTDEKVPVQNLTLIITAPDSAYNHTCWFYPNGTEISGCDNITITRLTSAFNYTNGTSFANGYGFNYSSSSWMTTNTTFANSYGYGSLSGYGYLLASYSELEYNISWDSAGYPSGSYSIELRAEASDGTNKYRYSTSSVTSITLGAVAVVNVTESWGSGTPSEQTTSTIYQYDSSAGAAPSQQEQSIPIIGDIAEAVEEIGSFIEDVLIEPVIGSVGPTVGSEPTGDAGDGSGGSDNALLIGVIAIIAVIGGILAFLKFVLHKF